MIEYCTLDIINNSKYVVISKGQEKPAAMITLKAAGDMGYSEESNIARKKIFTDLCIDEGRLIQINQIHSKKIYFINSDTFNIKLQGDGLITKNRNYILSVTVADCLPIFLYDKESGYFSLLHSGWKGTGIGSIAIENIWKKIKTNPKNIEIIMGPSIGPCCYKVDKERAQLFSNNWGKNSVIKRDNNYFIDLKEANKRLFIDIGIKNIKIINNCTCCSSSLGSYRRQGPDLFTKMLAVYGYFDI